MSEEKIHAVSARVFRDFVIVTTANEAEERTFTLLGVNCKIIDRFENQIECERRAKALQNEAVANQLLAQAKELKKPVKSV